MPDRLPVFLLITFFTKKLLSWTLFALRCLIVTAIWLAFVPWANINFLRSVFWIADVLIWASGSANSSWTGTSVLEAYINTTLHHINASYSSPAAPVPLHQAVAANISMAAANQSHAEPAPSDTDAVMSLLSHLMPSRIIFMIARLIVSPSDTVRATTIARRSWLEDLHRFDWSHRFSALGHDIFVGQIFTCVLFLAVIAAWFTREWVLMHLPAHVPGIDLRDNDVPAQQPQEQNVPPPPPVDGLPRDEEWLDRTAYDQATLARTRDMLDAMEEQLRQTEDGPIESGEPLGDTDSETDWLPPASATDPQQVRNARLARFSAASQQPREVQHVAPEWLDAHSRAESSQEAPSSSSSKRMTRSQSAAAAAAAADLEVDESEQDRETVGRFDGSSPAGHSFEKTDKGKGKAKATEDEIGQGGSRSPHLEGLADSGVNNSSSIDLITEDNGEEEGWSDATAPDSELPAYYATGLAQLLLHRPSFEDIDRSREQDETVLRRISAVHVSDILRSEARQTRPPYIDYTMETTDPALRRLYQIVRQALQRRETEQPGYIKEILLRPQPAIDRQNRRWRADITDAFRFETQFEESDSDDPDGERANMMVIPPPPGAPPRAFVVDRQGRVVEAAPPQPAPPQPAEEADWEEVGGDMEGLFEALGFRGGADQLLANVSILIALCCSVALLAIGFPYFLARLLGLGTGLLEIVMAPVRILRLITDPVFDFGIDWAGRTLGRLWTRASWHGKTQAFVSYWAGQGQRILAVLVAQSQKVISSAISPPGKVTASATVSPFHSSWQFFETQLLQVPYLIMDCVIKPVEAHMLRAESVKDRTICCLLGWLWVVAGLWLKTVVMNAIDKVRQAQGPEALMETTIEPLPQEHAAGANEALPQARQPLGFLDQAIFESVLIFKVITFLAIEILVFPIGCGIILDLSTLPLFGASVTMRWSRLLAQPLTYTFLRWTSGTLWMFRFGLYVSHVRSIVRPGVLSWIRDPEDPDFQPIKEILDRKAATQLRKIGASAVMYGTLIIAICAVNSWILSAVDHLLSLNILPLRMQSRGLQDQAGDATSLRTPLDFVSMTLAATFLRDMANAEAVLANISRRWWRLCAYHLGLTKYVFAKSHKRGKTEQLAIARTFLARIPASDNSVSGSPLLIRLDEHGEPVSERGKEAQRLQEEKIAAMKEPKAKYTTMRLPVDFGLRVKALVALQWLLVSQSVPLVLVPVMIGRWYLQAQVNGDHDAHDGWALLWGVAILSPLILGICLACRDNDKVRLFFDRPALGGLGELIAERAKQQKRARKTTKRPRLSSRHSSGSSAHVSKTSESGSTQQPSENFHWIERVREVAAKQLQKAMWLASSVFLLPACLGLFVDQVWISPLRQGTLLSPPARLEELRQQSSIPYCWALGLLLWQLIGAAAPWASNTSPGSAFRLSGSGLACVMLPYMALLLAKHFNFKGLDEPSGLPEVSFLWMMSTSLRIAIVAGAVTALLRFRFTKYEKELRDEQYLQARELRNYDPSETGGGEESGERRGQEQQEPWQEDVPVM